MRIVAGVGDLIQRISDGRTGQVLGGRAILRSDALCVICTMHMETRSTDFLVEPQNQGRRFVSGLASKPVGPVWPQNRWVRFLSLDLKTGSCGLVIWTSKSPRWFFCLGLKTKQASVCQLCHKIDGGRMTCDTSRDLVACFAWKQVALGFSSLATRPAEARRRVVHVAPS
jgi:hypothetical protein